MPTDTVPVAHRTPSPGRSTAAVFAAILANVVLSLATDQVLHTLGIYPPWGEAMRDPALNLLALGYRVVYGVLAGYVVARLAPSNPMRHVRILGMIAAALATIGVVVAIAGPDLGPLWYPIALAVTAYPSVLLGGALHARRAAAT